MAKYKKTKLETTKITIDGIVDEVDGLVIYVDDEKINISDELTIFKGKNITINITEKIEIDSAMKEGVEK